MPFGEFDARDQFLHVSMSRQSHFNQNQGLFLGLCSWPDKYHVSVNDSERNNELLLITIADGKMVAGTVIMLDDKIRIPNHHNQLEQSVSSLEYKKYIVSGSQLLGIRRGGVTEQKHMGYRFV